MDPQVCGGCQAPYHPECVAELSGRCGTYGCQERLAVSLGEGHPLEGHPPNPRHELAGFVSGAGLLIALIVGVGSGDAVLAGRILLPMAGLAFLLLRGWRRGRRLAGSLLLLAPTFFLLCASAPAESILRRIGQASQWLGKGGLGLGLAWVLARCLRSASRVVGTWRVDGLQVGFGFAFLFAGIGGYTAYAQGHVVAGLCLLAVLPCLLAVCGLYALDRELPE